MHYFSGFIVNEKKRNISNEWNGAGNIILIETEIKIGQNDIYNVETTEIVNFPFYLTDNEWAD